MVQVIPRLTCLSLNVNGLRNASKRAALWHSLMRPDGQLLHDVVMLQEVHHQSATELREWVQNGAGRGVPVSAMCYEAAGTTASAGVVMLFATHLLVEDVVVHAAVLGRLLVVTCRIFDHAFCFVNVYAPHEPAARLRFCASSLAAHLPAVQQLRSATCIWGGDWNCVECPLLDQSNRCVTRESGYRDALAPVLAEFDMRDAFRALHPHTRAFSFARVPQHGPPTFSRLDRWYVSGGVLPHVQCVRYIDSISSLGVDHRACLLSLDLPSAPPMGGGVWSFPVSVLRDDDALRRLRHHVRCWIVAHPVSASFSAVDRWLALKLVVKHNAILLGKRLDRQRALSRHFARHRTATLATAWAADPASSSLPSLYNTARLHASDEAVSDAQRAARLASVAWHDYGERSTAWFHRLGQQRKHATVIHAVRPACAPEGAPSIDLRTSAGVLAGGDEIANFFDSDVPGALFRPGPVDAAAQEDLLGCLDRVLSEGDVAKCEAPLTLSELEGALRACATSKRPGLDGLPYELYSALWELLAPPLLDCWSHCLVGAGIALPPAMVEGCISTLR